MSNDNLNETKLKQWSIKQAIEAGAGRDVISVAQSIHNFISKNEVQTKQVQDIVEPVKKHWSPHVLSALEEKVLSKMIGLYQHDEKISGVRIAKDTKIAQSYVSKIIVQLVEKQYVHRIGNTFTPLLTVKGDELPLKKKELKAGFAQGYKPMSSPMGKVARAT